MGLWGSTSYQICGFLENIYGNVSSYSNTGLAYDVHYWSTAAMDVNYSWSITASGTTSMASVNATTIRDVVSYYQGVNPARNVMGTPNETSNTTRRL